jgi:hypothetical protein
MVRELFEMAHSRKVGAAGFVWARVHEWCMSCLRWSLQNMVYVCSFVDVCVCVCVKGWGTGYSMVQTRLLACLHLCVCSDLLVYWCV